MDRQRTDRCCHHLLFEFLTIYLHRSYSSSSCLGTDRCTVRHMATLTGDLATSSGKWVRILSGCVSRYELESIAKIRLFL
ncbi:hypothetical protein PoMZ_11202 [Pyricularia oryzae]|uniref:Uncharacterized protein n=1 Tax=Pyricularia oryzae TaxID=318829 RepID=A0A4P7NJT4_PYROR|nr:hypothetical protein PoMZ_11202 [Pyricularia oryzae]